MNLLLILALIANNTKSVEVRFTETAPIIDGVIEEIWQNADSAYDFVQFAPYEKEKPSEKTSVYLLQDKDNLYIAFRARLDKKCASSLSIEWCRRLYSNLLRPIWQ